MYIKAQKIMSHLFKTEVNAISKKIKLIHVTGRGGL
jgi:hypothetical protein